MTGTDISDALTSMIDDSGLVKVTSPVRIRWINLGTRTIRHDCPETQLGPTGLSKYTPIAALGDTISLPDDLFGMLLDFVAWRVFSMDSADVRDLKRAAAHEAAYLTHKGGAPVQETE